jgi:Skp family chaperone for outer membrane proteins
MCRTGILSLAISAAMLPIGCETKTPSTKPPEPKIANAKEKIGEAADATIAVAKAKRDEYARDMQKKLDELDAKHKALEKRAAEAKGDAKRDLDEKVKTANAKRDAAAKKLDELKEASHDRWEKVKDGFESAFEDLKKVFE